MQTRVYSSELSLLTPQLHLLSALKPNEVRITVKAFGVNRADLLQRQGKYPPPTGVTSVLGLEVAGLISEVGSAVIHWKPGDRVMALLDGGGYAETANAHEDLCLHLPDDLSFVEGAALPEALFTVWNSLIQPQWVKAGETILIHGGSTGIGAHAIQMMRAVGLTVLTTVRTPEKAALCHSLGAQRAILYEEEDFAAICREHTKDNGVDVILDCIGGSYVRRNIEALGQGGRLVHIGCQQGAVGEIPLVSLMRKRLIVTGSTLRDQPLSHKKHLSCALKPFAQEWIATKRLHPVVGATYPFDQVDSAHELMKSQKHSGKIVVYLS